MCIFRAVILTPLFSAALAELIARNNLTQVSAAQVAQLSRNIICRLVRGEQWPNHEHIAAVVRLAKQEEDRRQLIEALQSDVAAAGGVDRFQVAESGGVVLLRVPSDEAELIERVLLLARVSPSGKLAVSAVVDSMIPAVLRNEAGNYDSARLGRQPSTRPRKNAGAPTARLSLPPKPKAS